MSSPRLSAAVVLVRPVRGTSAAWETYLLRRNPQSPLLAETWVFPGGTLRPDDLASAATPLSHAFGALEAHAALGRPPDHPANTPEASYAHFVAAARELIEEAGVVLTGTDDSRPVAARQTVALAAQRERLEQGAPLAELAAETGVAPALDRLIYYAHWITPEAVPQRYDTRFFLATLPDGQEASPSRREMMDGRWISADEALERARGGALPLHFATLSHLRRLAPFRDLDDLLGFAATKPIIPVMPETEERDGRRVPFLRPEIMGAW